MEKLGKAPCGAVAGGRHPQGRPQGRDGGSPHRSAQTPRSPVHLDDPWRAPPAPRSTAAIGSGDVAGCKAAARQREQRLERLIGRLPRALQATLRWLRRPSSRWARITGGILLIAGAFLSILPLFGLWMLPLGLALLAEDIAPLQRARDRLLDWIERHRPHWFTGGNA